MLRKTYILFLFLFQCLLIVKGKDLIGRDGNPFILFAISILIPILFLQKTLQNKEKTLAAKKTQTFLDKRIWGFIFGCLPLILMNPAISNMFHEFQGYANSSDVIPQLEALYTRWTNGIFPYYPLEQFDWHPYPVYMPLNWLPLAISYIMHIDVRWSGIILLLLGNGVWGWYIWDGTKSLPIRLIGIILPIIPLCFYMKWARFDISVSLETIIAAYYLVLAVGLASKNIWLITTGLILCILSRYTLVFWLPLFAALLLMNKPLKTNIIVWGVIAVAIFAIYIIPFYLKDPTILAKGVTYHNGCAIAEWQGYPETSWTFNNGIYFAPYILKITSGTMEHRVYIARSIQAIIMLITCFGGIALYRRLKDKIDFYDFSLAFLYLTILLFYIFSPLLYLYYYIVLMCLSAILCAKILMQKEG